MTEASPTAHGSLFHGAIFGAGRRDRNRPGRRAVQANVEAEQVLTSPLGRISISSDAIAHIVGETARECYGVVEMAGRADRSDGSAARRSSTRGIHVARDRSERSRSTSTSWSSTV